MNEYLKNLNRIEFVVTNSCTGKCKHCSQGEHSGCEYLEKSVAADVIRKIAGEYKIDSVMTFGGEALLFPECVCEIHKAAEEVGIKKRQLITNGYFSEDFKRIADVAEMLALGGVNEILLSVDAFHQEIIPIEYVIQFAKEIKKNNIPIKTNPAWLGGEDDNNSFNVITRKILEQFTSLGIETGKGNTVFASGNALKFLGKYSDLINTEKNPYDEDPYNIKTVSISSDGDVLNGNIYHNDIMEIISLYLPY